MKRTTRRSSQYRERPGASRSRLCPARLSFALGRQTLENYQMKMVYFSLAILLAGCASNSGVIPIGPDTFMVSRQAATGFSGSGTLKAEAFQEANQYCLSQHKKLQVVNTTEAQPPFILGNFPKAEVQFMCLDANDSELVRPKLREEADTVIEIRK